MRVSPSLIASAVLAAGGALPGPSALAQDDASPAGQVYVLTFENVAPTYGGNINFTFDAGGLIDSATDGGIGAYNQPGGTGEWIGAGSVQIMGDEGGDQPSDDVIPPPPLQLLAEGQSSAYCETWPQIAVGESADPQDLCWITNPHVTAVMRRQ